MGAETITSIDLNCDLGEYENLIDGDHDAAIMPYISSCNIACGGHAGNQTVVDHTIKTAIENQVQIGAHPAYPDRINFGRKKMHLPASELKPILREQINLIKTAANVQNAVLSHVKPHGALYNQAAQDFNLALLLAETIADCDSSLQFYGLAHSVMAQAAMEVGVTFIAEGFVDRAYRINRTLQPRHQAGAVISDVNDMLQRTINLLQTGKIKAVSGEVIKLSLQTLCLHGDHAGAEKNARFVQQGLIKAGIEIRAPQS